MTDPIVDLFAGPGGWSEGLKALGYSELGIEWDEAACLTARAAGHERIQADVAAMVPMVCWGLIASPPCQAWSMAGKGGGRRDKELCVRAALDLAAGNDTRAELAAQCEDERSMLVVEPLRWALATRPEWIAMEQVPPVLEMWTLFAQILSQHGYKVWAGVLEAERYGVPQTRERAILMASRVGEVHPPVATHQRYVKGEPQRHDVTMEGEVLPWVSMAQALGWGMTERPCMTVAAGSGRQGGPSPLDGGSGARAALRHERTRGAWEDADQPATTVACDARIAPRGHHDNHMTGAVRVTVEQAAALQSFRPDYPWQGSRTKQFEQVGNAVPPRLAQAVLAALIPTAEAFDVAA